MHDVKRKSRTFHWPSFILVMDPGSRGKYPSQTADYCTVCTDRYLDTIQEPL